MYHNLYIYIYYIYIILYIYIVYITHIYIYSISSDDDDDDDDQIMIPPGETSALGSRLQIGVRRLATDRRWPELWTVGPGDIPS